MCVYVRVFGELSKREGKVRIRGRLRRKRMANKVPKPRLSLSLSSPLSPEGLSEETKEAKCAAVGKTKEQRTEEDFQPQRRRTL